MIEDYGTLSEQELVEEIRQELEESTDLDPNELEFKFDSGKLIILGTLPNEEALENLVGVLENHVDPEDYELEVDLLEGQVPEVEEEFAEKTGDQEETEKLLEESLEDIDEEEIDFMDEEGFEDDEKW